MITEFDLNVLDFIQNHMKCEFLDKVLPPITHLGDAGIFWILLGVVFLFSIKTRKLGFQMLAAMALGYLLGNLILKNVIARERPYTINTNIQLLIKEQLDYSFPSGHTLASFNSAITIFFYRKKWGLAALILAAIIAFSRMYLYVHFPTDILGGILLAMFVTFTMKGIFDRFVPGEISLRRHPSNNA